jgi:hypothetical protein
MSKTGEVYVYAQEKELLSALLYDFDIGSPVVKTQHRDWLNTNAPRYFARDMKAIVVGLASRTGSDVLNMKLSRHRAMNVETIFRALAPASARPVMDLRVALGEEAAAIAGIKDGVEDERWRAVFLGIVDPHKVTFAEVLRDNMIRMSYKRRTHVTLIVGQEVGKLNPSGGEPGERAAQFGMQVAAGLGISGDQIQHEETAIMDQGDTVLRIAIKRRDTSGGGLYTIKYLDIDYQWGRLNGGDRTLVIKPSDDDLKLDRSLRDEVLPLSVAQMNRWLSEPYIAWDSLGRL